jgi:hypothetical protein
MSTPQLDRLRAACHRLRLYQIEAEVAALLEQAAKRDVSDADFLDEVLGREVGVKTQKHLAMRVAMARFPFPKTLESFDFKFQPSIDAKLVRELATACSITPSPPTSRGRATACARSSRPVCSSPSSAPTTAATPTPLPASRSHSTRGWGEIQTIFPGGDSGDR